VSKSAIGNIGLMDAALSSLWTIGVIVGAGALAMEKVLKGKKLRKERDGFFSQLEARREMISKARAQFETIDKENFSSRFYENFFTECPQYKLLFSTPIKEQQKILMVMIDYLFGKSTDREIISNLQVLGRRHAGYGVKPSHFNDFAEALEMTLKELEVEDYQNWLEIFGIYVSVMISAMEKERVIST